MATKKEVLKTEATVEEAEDLKVDFRGDTYALPANMGEWDIEVIEAYEDGHNVAALRALLGDEQWQFLKAKHRPRVKDLDEITNVFLGAIGLSLEKSES